LILAAARQLPEQAASLRAGQWQMGVGHTLRSATLGIFGYGRIGRVVAGYGAAFEMPVKVWGGLSSRAAATADGHHAAKSKRELFETSDVVSIHTPLNDETRGLIDGRFFAAARPGMTLVNTARGAVVSLPDLLKALDAGILRGVALDVLPVEPVPAESPLTRDPRVILTPHAAFFSVEAEQELRRKAAQNIVSWVRTGRPDYPVVQGTRQPG